MKKKVNNVDSNQPVMKADIGKTRWDLTQSLSMEEYAKVLTFGASKYSPYGWRSEKGPKGKYFAALQRHLSSWINGQQDDPETGLHHLAHAMCSLAFIMESELGQKYPGHRNVIEDEYNMIRILRGTEKA